MKVVDTIRSCISNYPSIFPHRAQVLEHLFFTNGNGYEWVEGELVDSCPVSPGHSPFWDENPPKDSSSPLMWEIKVKTAQEQNAKSRVTLSELDQRCQPSDEWVLEKVYPICKYAKIMNIPEEIKPDWLEAAKEAIALAQGVPTYENYPADYNQKWLDKAREKISQLER